MVFLNPPPYAPRAGNREVLFAIAVALDLVGLYSAQNFISRLAAGTQHQL